MICKGVLLDIDNTLYAYAPCHERGLEASFLFLKKHLRCNKAQFVAAYRTARHEIHERLHGTASSHNRLLYFQAMLEKAGKDALTLSYSADEKYWEAYLRGCVLDAGARKLISFLKTKRVCLLTDLTADIQFRKVLRLNLKSFAQSIVTSEEVGSEKPEAEMFKAGLKKLKLSVSQTVMIGDHLDRDIIGAAKLGMRALWLTKHIKDSDRSIPASLRKRIFICRDYDDVIRHLQASVK